ncbi:MAG: hypothetical protein ACYCS1_04415 [Gammaproteobacteria bacterium]
MINGLVVDTQKITDGHFLAQQNEGASVEFTPQHKLMIYRSSTLNRLGFYNDSRIDSNLGAAKNLYLKHMSRQKKIVFGNKAFLKHKKGVFPDIIYWDFKRFYPLIFTQIANHVDEEYLGKQIKGIVKRKQFISKINGISKTASKAKLVQITDIAKNSISIDKNNKDSFCNIINDLSSQTEFFDDADRAVSKIIRNSLAYGFGYQQKHARINNISALVMYFASLIMSNTVKELEDRGHDVIFSHTDSFQIGHMNTREIEDCIIASANSVDAEYFGGTGIIHMNWDNISSKEKFEDVMILNQNSYIYTKQAARGKLELGLAMGGMHTLKTNALGITRDNESLQEILNEHIPEILSNDKEFFKKYENKMFLFSLIKYRLSEDYKNRLIQLWQNKDSKLYKKAIIQDNTISALQVRIKEALL